MLDRVDPITCVDAMVFDDDIVSTFIAFERSVFVDFFGDSWFPLLFSWSIALIVDTFS